ncbi:MAG: MFS transporter, partial [Alphaproteobacteria bacterium]|nr:MFS transporter [Alphaproteobacteria bacterium]
FFGWLSDKIGRKPIILGGCALAAISYFPLFAALTTAANPALAAAQASAPVTIVAHGGECSFQFDPVGKNRFDQTSCDVAKAYMAKSGVNYANVEAAAGSPAVVKVGSVSFTAPDATTLAGPDKTAAIGAFQDALKAGLARAGYPEKADNARIDKVAVVAILWALAMLVTMVYGPIAAMLVELFPSRIRYTSMSLPYHIGNGWFGGFLPTTAFAMVAATGNIYYGLWYPVLIAAATVVVGLLFLPETFRRNIDE